ncbi:MAG: hypothetical protein QOE62_260 [Actinomycetota bacterium]|jgi:F0F1-type ATP synthase membrane subunit c/vacuolar-type H+-ATPase subunit K|nr:hypothetical protein [Actinomycetota bacterium]
MLLFLVPGMAQMQMRRARSEHGLLMLRRLFLSFSIAIVLIGVVVSVISTKGDSVFPWLPIVVGWSILSLGVGRVVEKPLDCATDMTLAGSYRTRFFLRIALPESIALLAFVAAFGGAPKWIYYLGAAITLVGFWAYAAPTRAALARDQEALNAAGCTRSLVAALRGSSGTEPAP